MLPASWVRAGNAHGAVTVRQAGQRGGSYSHSQRRITVGAEADVGTALHEYVHHLQGAMPGFQRVFRAEHLRRTTTHGKRDPLTTADGGGYSTRADDYTTDYAGRDYGTTTAMDVAPGMDMPDGDALEVATTAFQAILHQYDGREVLGTLAKSDPRMLNLVLGLLFRFDP